MKCWGAGRRGRENEEEEEDGEDQEEDKGVSCVGIWGGGMNWVLIQQGPAEVGRDKLLELSSADASVLSSGNCKGKQ